MAERDTVLGDDELRLYDVLLEEELAAHAAVQTASATPPRRAAYAWPLVAALLGITVVVASWFVAGRVAPSAAMSPQDPPLEVVPFDPARLPGTVAIRLRVGRLVNERGDGFLDPDLPPLVIQEAAVVADWREALTRHLDAVEGVHHNYTYRLELDLGDGTMMVGRANAIGQCEFGKRRFLGDDGLKRLLGNAITAARRARGVATSVAELAQLPPNSRAIAAPWLSGEEARSSLARFPDLESIEFLFSATGGVVSEPGSLAGKDLALGLAEIRSLREIHVLAGHLHDDALRALVVMPNLHTLGIGEDPRAIPAAEFGELVQRLEVLRVPDGPLSDEQLAAIRNAPRLRELWLAVDRPTQALADCLRSLPRLRRLSIAGRDTGDECDLLIRSIANTRVEELRFARTVMAVDALAPLADLPTLHTMVLEWVRTPEDGFPAVAALHRLRHLQVNNEVNLLNTCRKQLPACEVHGDSPLERWRSPFARRDW